MADLLITRTCASHVAHGGTMELSCFDEATLRIMALLTEYAHVDDLTRLMRDWLNQEDQGSATLVFEDVECEEVFVLFTV